MKPKEFIKAAIGRKAIPLDVLLDQATKSTITLAVEDGTFDADDLQYLWELAKALHEEQMNPLSLNPLPPTPLLLWAVASFLSFTSSIISIHKTGKIPLVVGAKNPRRGAKRARFRLRDKALEGTLLAASFIMVRREGTPRLAKAIKKRAMALFPRTWKPVLGQFGDPDDPEMGDLAVTAAEAALEAASIDDLRTILPGARNVAKAGGMTGPFPGGLSWWPVWRPVSGRPWVLKNEDSEMLRRPEDEGTSTVTRKGSAYTFDTANKALAFFETSKGRKAVAAQEARIQQ